MNISALTQFHFDQAPAAATLTSVADGVYVTPDELQEDIKSLSRLAYLNSTFSGTVLLSASDTVTVDVVLTDGVETFATETVVITATTRADFKVENINLKCASGNLPIYVQLNVTSAAAAATGQIFSKLTTEYPLINLG